MNPGIVFAISLIAGALITVEVMYFVKMWNMTGDVKKIRSKIFSSQNDVMYTATKNVFLGHKEKALEALLDVFFDNVLKLKKDKSNEKFSLLEAEEKKNAEEWRTKKFIKTKEDFLNNCNELGLEVPEKIAKMETYSELF